MGGTQLLFLLKVVSSVWFMMDEDFTSNVCIACLYIDCDLFPVVISWDSLPVSDGADWVSFLTSHWIPELLSGELEAMNTGVMASSLAPEYEEISVESLKKEGMPPETLWRQLQLRANLNT